VSARGHFGNGIKRCPACQFYRCRCSDVPAMVREQTTRDINARGGGFDEAPETRRDDRREETKD
jgi:hypothetical protein